MFLFQACFSSRFFAKLNLKHTGVAAPCVLSPPSVDTELVLVTCSRHHINAHSFEQYLCNSQIYHSKAGFCDPNFITRVICYKLSSV